MCTTIVCDLVHIIYLLVLAINGTLPLRIEAYLRHIHTFSRLLSLYLDEVHLTRFFLFDIFSRLTLNGQYYIFFLLLFVIHSLGSIQPREEKKIPFSIRIFRSAVRHFRRYLGDSNQRKKYFKKNKFFFNIRRKKISKHSCLKPHFWHCRR